MGRPSEVGEVPAATLMLLLVASNARWVELCDSPQMAVSLSRRMGKPGDLFHSAGWRVHDWRCMQPRARSNLFLESIDRSEEGLIRCRACDGEGGRRLKNIDVQLLDGL